MVTTNNTSHSTIQRIKTGFLHWMPGLMLLFSYKKSYFNYDLRAGLSVAAVALPVSIAYADLTGVGAIAGLYSTLLPLIAYALFGSSKQLIIGPDTATCAVVAAVVFPLAANDPLLRWQLVILLTLMVGFWCVIASRVKLGALADLLSRPILIGLLSGISITIILDQLAKVLGFRFDTSSFISRLITLPELLVTLHGLTCFISAVTFALLIAVKRYRPRWPAPLIAIIGVTLLCWLGGFEQHGVKIVGAFNGDMLPFSSWIGFDLEMAQNLVVPSLNIAVICFISMMITVRSFAAKHNYDTDADVELRALGIANIVSGLSSGFVVSGTSSRTAVNDANGGKTQLVSIIAAMVIAAVILFFLSPLQHIPIAVLGVILIYSSYSLIDLRVIWAYFKQNRDAFYLSLTTLISVLLIGIIPGMALAVLLGLFLFLRRIFRPKDQQLGIDEEGRIHSLSSKVKPLDNTLIYRFNSPLTYFNIAYFKRRVMQLIKENPQKIKYVVVDTIPCFTYQDVSVLIGISELVQVLGRQNIVLILAGRRKTLKRWFKALAIPVDERSLDFSYDLYFSVKMIQSKLAAKDAANASKEEVSPSETNIIETIDSEPKSSNVSNSERLSTTERADTSEPAAKTD